MKTLTPLRTFALRPNNNYQKYFSFHSNFRFPLNPFLQSTGQQRKFSLGTESTAIATREASIPLSAPPSSLRVLSNSTGDLSRYKVLRQIGSVHVLTQLNKRVKHQRVTPVLDVFEDQENLYIVLELLGGGELFEKVIERGKLPEVEVAIIIRKLVYALEALHLEGILHRDIKLENIVMRETEDDFALTDFGFAVDRTVQNHSTGRFKKNELAGTLGYVAPEVLRDRNYSPASDVWSAGVVMYILLSGRPPFPTAKELEDDAPAEEKISAELEAIDFGRTPTEWRKSMMEEPWNSISFEAKRLVSKMLEVDPKKRITTDLILQDAFITRHTQAHETEFTDFE